MRVPIPLDRGGTLPGRISLRVRIAPPERGIVKGTILALAGGPGQAAAPLLNAFRNALGDPVLRDRRLVTFDQRGTGRSGQLRCPELDHIPFDGADMRPATQRAVAACAVWLGPARAHYTTADSVQDIEAVRAALGVDRMILYGTSYGTKVALDYAAAYPQHVEKLVLDSVVVPEGVDPFERSTIAAIPSVLRSVCAGGACPFTRDAGADMLALGERLARGPLRGQRIDGYGHAHVAGLVGRALYPLLLIGDELPFERALLPAAVRAALDGDPALLLRLAKLRFGDFDASGPDSTTLLLATRCEDGGLPWGFGTPVDARAGALGAALAAIPPGQLVPFTAADVRDFGITDLCRAWPEAPIAQPHPPLPNVPALILSGDEDLRTPRADALAVAARIPGARVIAVPHTGHSTLTSEPGHCAGSAVTEFLAGREPRSCRRMRRDALSTPLGLPPRRLGDVRALGPRRLPPDVRRTLGAVSVTVDLLGRTFFVELIAQLEKFRRHQKALRFGGLRGGSLVLADRAAFLRRYSVVPGVTLSIRELDEASDDAPTLLHIGGSAAARGWLRINRRWTTGRLGGHRFRMRTKLFEPDSASLASARAATSKLPSAPQLPPLPPQLRKLLG
jgi:pimeloyl-ACP methyl ester carboxylesterase